ncbi:gamma-butyrobetaine hydroxylase-like domain-containing protein [Bradyrhizobium sp. USDA 3315]
MTMTALVAPTVTDYEASADLATLVIRTAHDDEIRLAAEQLRLSCKCAHCTRARFDGRFPERFPGIAITEIGDLGYGLNISFSDGHNRGIYPKIYLLSLAGH